MDNKKIAFAGITTALMILSTFVKIPFQPVPITLQPFIALLIPMIFGVKISFTGIFLYLLLGLLGLPIFANGGGLSYFLQPTFGYLVGFLFAAIPIGFFSNKIKGFKGKFIGGIIGLFLIYALGVLYLYYNINYIQNKTFTLSTALKVGFFLPVGFDFIKLIIACIISNKININK